ncbi:AVB_G0047060.mRNA.1.CDS.1 [Saccharomyces cerevisiae]|nr:AVB_G0047060.mRNA.1.CDS.1 [Saccharomyces cerevisiae]CAI7316556.1 AVB_G0047060.mRNA.1.CDS.1 [Saccharomyces cerevisiae]
MQESKNRINLRKCPRIFIFIHTLVGTSFEEPRCGTSQGKEEDAFACAIMEITARSIATNVQEDDWLSFPELLPSFEISIHTFMRRIHYFMRLGSRNQNIPSEAESGKLICGFLPVISLAQDNHEVTVDEPGLVSGPSMSLKFVIMMILKVSQLRIYALPRIKPPIATELYVTKTAPKFGQLPKHESMLREYTSGDNSRYFHCRKQINQTSLIRYVLFNFGRYDKFKTQSPFGIQNDRKNFENGRYGSELVSNHEDVNTGEDLLILTPLINSFGLPNSRILNPGDKRKKFSL